MIQMKPKKYQSKRGPGYGPNADAGGLGYGAQHQDYPWYLAVTTIRDLPAPSYAPLPTPKRFL